MDAILTSQVEEFGWRLYVLENSSPKIGWWLSGRPFYKRVISNVYVCTLQARPGCFNEAIRVNYFLVLRFQSKEHDPNDTLSTLHKHTKRTCETTAQCEFLAQRLKLQNTRLWNVMPWEVNQVWRVLKDRRWFRIWILVGFCCWEW